MPVIKKKVLDSEGKEVAQWDLNAPVPTDNLIGLPQQPIGSITLILGKVEVQEFNTTEWKKAKFKHKLFEKDIVRVGDRSRVEIKLPSDGEVGERYIVRIGKNSEYVTTTTNLKEAARNYGISQYKQGNLYEIYETTFKEKPKGKKRVPIAVAAIRG